jgi:two-component system, OmpR family, heavy metal sensor histidine kinase CusS
VDLGELLANVVEDCTALAPTLKIEQTIPAGIAVQADAVLLEQAIQNLAGNALKYNRDDGRIRFELGTDARLAVISVGNTGPGIAPADRPHVFERFFRGDGSRNRQAASGVGLGLSLSREILRAHHGDLVLAPVQDDWTVFVATLPLPPTA